MKNRSKKFMLFFGTFLIMGMLPFCLFAQDFQIGQVLPYLSNDSLQVAITVNGLMENQIRKTLLSGIPVNFGVELILIEQDQKELVKNQYVATINYDVWEESFRIKDFRGIVREFELLEEVKRWVGNMEAFTLVPQEKLSTALSYQVRAKLEVLLTTRKQNQQLKYWLGRSDPTEEEMASEERSTGFKLNLNQLVQMFFSSDQEPNKYSVTRMSEIFQPEDLEFQ